MPKFGSGRASRELSVASARPLLIQHRNSRIIETQTRDLRILGGVRSYDFGNSIEAQNGQPYACNRSKFSKFSLLMEAFILTRRFIITIVRRASIHLNRA